MEGVVNGSERNAYQTRNETETDEEAAESEAEELPMLLEQFVTTGCQCEKLLEAEELPMLKQHYEDAERILKEIQDNPSLAAEGGLFQLLKDLAEKFPEFMGLRLTKPITEEEISRIRETRGAFIEFFETRFRQIMSEEDSDVREGIAAGVRRIMPSKFGDLHRIDSAVAEGNRTAAKTNSNCHELQTVSRHRSQFGRD